MKATFVLWVFVLIMTISCSSPPGIEEGHIDVNGASLFYKTMGSGEPIVVLHGGPGFDHRQFLPYIWELASRHKVILYDQRGTGLSSGPVNADSINIDTFIADIEAVRQAFGIETLNLFGHSWGGILAMHYAIRHPDRLRSLILCSTTGSREGSAEMRAAYQARRPAEETRLLNEIQASSDYRNKDAKAIERFWRLFFRPYFANPDLVEGMDLQFTENTIENGDAVAGYVLQSIGEFDLYDDLKVIESPTLILHGDADPMPLKYAQRIQASIAGSELVVAHDSGHWLFVDATDTFRDSILDFLARVTDR